jgi:hypothetical protein
MLGQGVLVGSTSARFVYRHYYDLSSTLAVGYQIFSWSKASSWDTSSNQEKEKSHLSASGR